MLLKCPHCDDEANIPNALSQYENMPIACHACGGFFFAPPLDSDDPTPRRQDNITRSNRQIECAQCDIPVLIPDIDAAGARHKFSCPACHADLPPLPPELKSPPKALSTSRPASKSRTRTRISILTIAIAVGVGVGIALGVLLSQNMIALDLDALSELASQTGQQLTHIWNEMLTNLSSAF
ncbi:MAG: hypothetical protein HOH48_05705 [Candidatus Puniceispirillum sp.]|jgi:hypothetical protein|uniref:hypothetical protein n=1 Tax=Candidatus Puniceispirillum sp. TaxID=2026719 RepID=UPI001EC502A0|nr:hypothetical protein [Candidatus Puniceispirillum sp.]MBT6415915.1 hypothetical protein [Candidatus Puniceispirillum sp.]MBT6566855.1 hypothetical protein [Candidatus Puniceispirillum sp.]